MARIMAEWHPKHGPITKIMLLDGVKGNTDLLALELWYDFHEVGCHLLLWTAPDGIKRARMRSL